MPIEFICPNGHKLRVADNQAGRTVKCPRCAAAAKVPAAAPAEQEAALVGSGSGTQPAPKAGGSDLSKSGSLAVAEARDSRSSLFDELGLGDATAGGSGNSAGDSGKPNEKPAGGSDKLAGGSGKLSGGVEKLTAASDKPTKTDKPADPLDEVLVFLCPNGHKLNAKRRLQGHVGQCPHCNAKFRIPMWDESQPDGGGIDLGGFQIPADPVAGDNRGDEVYDLADVVPPPGSKPAETAGKPGAAATAAGAAATTVAAAAVPTGPHPLAQLVTRLWAERDHGGVVELHLEGGVMIAPEWFEKSLSQNTHGLFAVLAADGTVTMTIVPWDSITRVVVRGVVGLPDGMFE